MVVIRNQEAINLPFRNPLFTRDEMDKVDQLIGYAAMSEAIRDSLLKKQDPQLRAQFDLSESLWNQLISVNARSIEELCDQVCRWQLLAC